MPEFTADQVRTRRSLQPAPVPTASASPGGTGTGKPRLYFAAPLDLMGTPDHRDAIVVARAQFPGHRIVDPSRKGWSTSDWLTEWPGLLPLLETLTVIPREDGSIGAGCFREIYDARDAGIPVWVFSRQAHSFLPFERMRRFPWQKRTLIRYGVVSHAVRTGAGTSG
jgi:hypothetical protein